MTKSNYKKALTEAAKMAMKHENVKLVLNDIKHHFKQDGWPLSFPLYFCMSKLKHQDTFVRILVIKGYNVKVADDLTGLVIVNEL